MSDQSAESLPAVNHDAIAVKVRNVSKTYDLWDSPRDRLMLPLKRVMRSMLPAFMRRKIVIDEKSGPRAFHALSDISFDIRKGESWGFIGFNGSGKSTLLRIISGNLRPSSGVVEVDGKVAILDYSSGFNTDFTGRENIYLKGALLGLNRRQIDERVPAIEAFADIGEFIDQPAKTYSSGMTARLGFAIMAHVDAEILITDEALAVGDAFFVQKCMRHIRKFVKQGTFLFVSHSINDVMSLCDHAVWLEHGHVIRIGSARDICLAYQAAIERKSSQGYLGDASAIAEEESEAATVPVPEQVEPPRISRPAKRIKVTREQLSALKHHHAPLLNASPRELSSTTLIQIAEGAQLDDAMLGDGAVGGGNIFSVTITDEEQHSLTSVLGGETVYLTVRAIAEKPIDKPILGFQLKNCLGLTLIAENTFLATRDQELGLDPGEVISATFCFVLPLLPVGDYVIRAGLADGIEDNNALIDVRHEALLLHCTTSGARHGLVGVPMHSIVMEREVQQVLRDKDVCAQ